ncbi:MAG: hypothetical protein Q9213_002480 [Squamulea squamosa]
MQLLPDNYQQPSRLFLFFANPTVFSRFNAPASTPLYTMATGSLELNSTLNQSGQIQKGHSPLLALPRELRVIVLKYLLLQSKNVNQFHINVTCADNSHPEHPVYDKKWGGTNLTASFPFHRAKQVTLSIKVNAYGNPDHFLHHIVYTCGLLRFGASSIKKLGVELSDGDSWEDGLDGCCRSWCETGSTGVAKKHGVDHRGFGGPYTNYLTFFMKPLVLLESINDCEISVADNARLTSDLKDVLEHDQLAIKTAKPVGDDQINWLREKYMSILERRAKKGREELVRKAEQHESWLLAKERDITAMAGGSPSAMDNLQYLSLLDSGPHVSDKHDCFRLVATLNLLCLLKNKYQDFEPLIHVPMEFPNHPTTSTAASQHTTSGGTYNGDSLGKVKIVSLPVRPSWPLQSLKPTDVVPSNIIQFARGQQHDGPLMIVWSAQRKAKRKTWPTNFPDDTIVWFQGRDRQMIPFDRLTGALRLDTKLYASPKDVQKLEGSENQVQKRHGRILFCWGKYQDIPLPTVFGSNNAWYEASNREWIAFDRTTGEVRSDIDPFPNAQVGATSALSGISTQKTETWTYHNADHENQEQARQHTRTITSQAVQRPNQKLTSVPQLPSYQAPPAQAQPPFSHGWRADVEPFRSFHAVGMHPVDADPDVLWLRSGMHFRPMRISTAQQDNSVEPNLLVFREGLPSITIQEHTQSLRQQGSISDGSKDGTSAKNERAPVSDATYREAPWGGDTQPGSETLGDISSFTDMLNMDFIPSESDFQGVTNLMSPTPPVYSPCNGVPRPIMLSKGPQHHQGEPNIYTTGPLPSSICGGSRLTGLSALTSPAATIGKRSQAFDNN